MDTHNLEVSMDDRVLTGMTVCDMDDRVLTGMTVCDMDDRVWIHTT